MELNLVPFSSLQGLEKEKGMLFLQAFSNIPA